MSIRIKDIVLDKTQPIYMGIDVHKKTWSVTLIHQGQPVQRVTIFGLTPSEHSSGDKISRGPITGQGSQRLRSLVVEACWLAMREDPALKTIFERIYANTGRKNKAIVAIARSLVCRILGLMKRKENYTLGLVA